MAVDPQYRYSNDAEIDDEEICDDFKFKIPFGLHGFMVSNISTH